LKRPEIQVSGFFLTSGSGNKEKGSYYRAFKEYYANVKYNPFKVNYY